MREYVHECAIRDVFRTKERRIGTDYNRELTDGQLRTWEHFYADIPKRFVLDTERKFYIKNGQVYSMENGAKKVYDDRANLFVALRNTLVQLSPNSECRSEKHIFNYEY